MRLPVGLLISALLGTALPRSAHSQAAAHPDSRAGAPLSTAVRPEAVAIPDSVRRKVGYQHWKGGAIGTAAGAVAGLLLSAAVQGRCSDCSGNQSHTLETTLVGAGLGGAFGFLVGAASPKYRWDARPAASQVQCR